MDQSRLRELEDQCIQDCAPPCSAHCPAHVDVRALAASIANGDYDSAYQALTRVVPFPGIIARTCDQPCQAACYRKTRGGDIQIADLELACVNYVSETTVKLTRLPQKDARILVIGGGLSGMTAAFDLSKKGYQVDLFEMKEHLGGRLRLFSETCLPREVIANEVEIVALAGVNIHLNTKVDAKFLSTLSYDACLLCLGQQGSNPLDLDTDENGKLVVDPITFQTSQANVFVAGSLLREPSTIFSISDGRRAAISIDRFLQNVSLSASRANEGAYDTRLITNIDKVDSVEVMVPSTIEAGFSKEEAATEAKRCLQCDCMECVKVCEYLKHYGSYPRKYVRDIYNNLSIIMRARTANKMINSCTLCGLCGEVCPTDLNMAEVIHTTRQTMVKTNKMPPSAHDFALRDMAFSNSERAALILCANGKSTCDDLFFPGCQLAASNPEYIPQIFKALTSVLSDPGVMLGCCGAPADWSGEEDVLAQTMADFKTQWIELGSPRLVLACSSCQRMFKTHLPEVDAISIWEIFDQHQLFQTGVQYARPMVIHDPCTSRHEDVWQDAVRAGLSALKIDFHELEMSRNLTECCGYGGVAWLAHPDLVKDILNRRINEDDADYLTYCVMCRDMLAGEGKPTLHLLDLMYGQDLEKLAVRKGPDYSQRHENRLRAKQKMLNLLSGKDHLMPESYESYNLLLSSEMRKMIEERLILLEDIQKVIEHAETSGEKFKNQENGHTLACYKPNLITYWVEYVQDGDKFLVFEAYSHRMELQ